MTLVYITCRDEKEAEKISKHLLTKRLVACTNILPIKSMYWWDHKIVNEPEVLIIGKTNDRNFKKIIGEVKKLHSYDVPCILKINAAANKDYESWAKKELTRY